jgi:hypothetical protein
VSFVSLAESPLPQEARVPVVHGKAKMDF